MTTSLETLLNPRGIAVVGASDDRSKVGGQALHVLRAAGFRGSIHAVNPKLGEIDGIACHPSVRAIPGECDLTLVAVPAALVESVVDDCGARGVPYLVVLTAGLSTEQERTLQDKVRHYGMAMVGPNCQGIMNLQDRVLCGFGRVFEEEVEATAGPVAIVSQSGSYAFSAMSLARGAGIGFSHVISTGNELSLTSLHFAEHLLDRPEVKVVAMYLEGVRDGRRLQALGRRALELRKPILVWKVGSSRSGRQAALSHTANVTATSEVYRAVFREGGFVELEDMSDLADAVLAFLPQRLPRGRRIGVISQSGGIGVATADSCERHGLTLPPFSSSVEILRSLATGGNPVLNPADAVSIDRQPPDAYNRAVAAALADPAIDQLILRRGSVHLGAARQQWIDGLVDLARKSDKPLFVSLRPAGAEDLFQRLVAENVPVYGVSERAARAAAILAGFAEKVFAFEGRAAAASDAAVALDWPAAGGVLGEREAKRVLSRYGVPAVAEVFVADGEVAGLASLPFPFPAAVKLQAAGLHHKTEVGGVRLGVGSLEELKSAYAEMASTAERRQPGLTIEGALVQEMVSDGVEMLVGIVNDPHFGPVLALGLGGILTEVLQDVTHRLAPVEPATVRMMLEELKASRLLEGVRGRPAADIDALCRAVAAVSRLAWDHSDRIAAIDVNPLFVRPRGHGAIAADGLIVVNDAAAH